jgi:uncharacterized protein (DUF433 family)
VLAMLEVVRGMRLAPRQKRRIRDWLRAPEGALEFELGPAVVVRRVNEVDEARRRAERYARLRERWIVRDPEVKDGEPVIRGTRLTTGAVYARVAGGDTLAEIAAEYPEIPSEALEAAALYGQTHPRRGRPRRPWAS